MYVAPKGIANVCIDVSTYKSVDNVYQERDIQKRFWFVSKHFYTQESNPSQDLLQDTLPKQQHLQSRQKKNHNVISIIYNEIFFFLVVPYGAENLT